MHSDTAVRAHIESEDSHSKYLTYNMEVEIATSPFENEMKMFTPPRDDQNLPIKAPCQVFENDLEFNITGETPKPKDKYTLPSASKTDFASSSEEEDGEEKIDTVSFPNLTAHEKVPDGTEQYGLYLLPDEKQPGTAYLLTSSTSLGEVESCAKLTAIACLKGMNQNKKESIVTCTVVPGEEITVLKNKRVSLRYKILPGRTVNGKFINETHWMAGMRKPEAIAFELDVAGKLPRKVKLEEKNASEIAPEIVKSTTGHKGFKRKTPHDGADKMPTRSNKPNKKAKIYHTDTTTQQVLPPGKVNSPGLYCICKTPDDGRELIACESGDDRCPYNGWFHVTCQGLMKVPEGEWWCPLCRQGRDEGGDVPTAQLQ